MFTPMPEKRSFLRRLFSDPPEPSYQEALDLNLRRIFAKVQMSSVTTGTRALFFDEDGECAKSRAEIVDDIAERYRGQATYGNELVKRIVNFRAGIIVAGGLSLETDEGEAESREKEFISGLIDFNDLADFRNAQLGVEKEIEGQILWGLFWDASAEMVKAIYYPWSSVGYKANYDTAFDLVDVTWQDDQGTAQTLPADIAVFLKFNSRINEPHGWPTLSCNVVNCVNISKALADWRRINKLFASPTPFFKTEDDGQATAIMAEINSGEYDWKIGKAFASPSDYKLVGPETGGIESLEREIINNLRILSGGTDVPIQFLGLPSELSNRATADNMMEPVGISTTSEQNTWKSGFQDMFDKAIRIRNAIVPDASLREGIVRPKIATITANQLKQLVEIYIPLWEKQGLSLETMLSKVPDIPDDEAERVEETRAQRETELNEAAARLLEGTGRPGLELVEEEAV